ncbi:MAG: hypothetical protein U1F98_16220 [Verrucomicrobiota bacterium]
MKRSLLGFALALPVVISGCAWYTLTPISARETAGWAGGKPPRSEGYIVYQPELYFSATVTVETTRNEQGKEQTKENVSVTPLYLPNYQKPYRLATHNFLAKADFAFAIENGWKLTALSDKSDNSTMAEALAGQLKTMLAAAGLGKSPETATITRRVILYHPEFDPKTGVFTSFTPVSAIENSPTETR